MILFFVLFLFSSCSVHVSKDVNALSLSGLERVSPEHVKMLLRPLEVSAKRFGWHALQQEIRHRLFVHPRIQDFQLSESWNGAVKISIQERRLAGYQLSADGISFVDEWLTPVELPQRNSFPSSYSTSSNYSTGTFQHDFVTLGLPQIDVGSTRPSLWQPVLSRWMKFCEAFPVWAGRIARIAIPDQVPELSWIEFELSSSPHLYQISPSIPHEQIKSMMAMNSTDARGDSLPPSAIDLRFSRLVAQPRKLKDVQPSRLHGHKSHL